MGSVLSVEHGACRRKSLFDVQNASRDARTAAFERLPQIPWSQRRVGRVLSTAHSALLPGAHRASSLPRSNCGSGSCSEGFRPPPTVRCLVSVVCCTTSLAPRMGFINVPLAPNADGLKPEKVPHLQPFPNKRWSVPSERGPCEALRCISKAPSFSLSYCCGRVSRVDNQLLTKMLSCRARRHGEGTLALVRNSHIVIMREGSSTKHR